MNLQQLAAVILEEVHCTVEEAHTTFSSDSNIISNIHFWKMFYPSNDITALILLIEAKKVF